METVKEKKNMQHDSNALINKDEIGENSGDDTMLAKTAKANPAADDKAKQETSNKNQGPAIEDL